MAQWVWLAIWLAVFVGSSYLLGLIVYRLTLSARALKAEVETTAALAGELKNLEFDSPEPQRAATADDLVRLTKLRNSQKRKKALKREQRQRRLRNHLRNLEE